MKPPALVPTDADAVPQKWLAFLDQHHTATTASEGDADGKPISLPDVSGLDVLEPLGRGGMGMVFRVRDLLGREWAMKLVRPDKLSHHARDRFYEEALAMARLNHPYLVRVHVYHQPTSPEDLPYLLMPIYPTTLQHEWSSYQGHLGRCIPLLTAIADGLACLHEHGLVHRDVKPSNVLLDAEGRPAISDFGLAKDLTAESASEDSAELMSLTDAPVDSKASTARRRQTAYGAIMGTRHYMCPEQARGLNTDANPTWDVWAVGVMARELLIEPANTQPLPAEITRIIARCLEPQRERRYRNARELANDLHAWQQQGARRRRMRWFGLAILVVLACVAITLAMSPRKPEPPLTAEQQLDRAKQQLLTRLEKEGQAELIGQTKRPAYARFASGEVFAAERLWPADDVYTLESQRGTLLELVPEGLLGERYTIRGQVRLNDFAQVRGRAGFYFAHQRAWCGDGPVNVFMDVGLAHRLTQTVPEQVPILKTEQMGVFDIRATGYNADPGMRKELLHPCTFAGTHFIAVDRAKTKPTDDFQDVVIHVTPEGVQAVCAGQALPVVKVNVVHSHWRGIAQGLQLPGELAYQPNGGIGLQVWQASASFKAVRVEHERRGDQP